jgi:hypothetical protein
LRTAAEEEALAHFGVREPHLEAVVLTYKHMVNIYTLFHCTSLSQAKMPPSDSIYRLHAVLIENFLA